MAYCFLNYGVKVWRSNGSGLYLVTEFKNQMFMTIGESLFEQYRLECGMDDDDVRACTWHKAGLIDFAEWVHQQLLNKAHVSGSLELLQLLLNREQKVLADAKGIDCQILERRIDAISIVIWLIRDNPANDR